MSGPINGQPPATAGASALDLEILARFINILQQAVDGAKRYEGLRSPGHPTAGTMVMALVDVAAATTASCKLPDAQRGPLLEKMQAYYVAKVAEYEALIAKQREEQRQGRLVRGIILPGSNN